MVSLSTCPPFPPLSPPAHSFFIGPTVINIHTDWVIATSKGQRQRLCWCIDHASAERPTWADSARYWSNSAERSSCRILQRRGRLQCEIGNHLRKFRASARGRERPSRPPSDVIHELGDISYEMFASVRACLLSSLTAESTRSESLFRLSFLRLSSLPQVFLYY